MKLLFSQLKGWWQFIYFAVIGTEKTFTTGSINKAILRLSVPMILEMTMESLFVGVNLFFVSTLGKESIAIVGATESVILVAYAVAIGLGIAASAIVSRRTGEKDFKSAGHAAMQIIYLAIVLSVVFSLCGLLFYDDILHLVGLPLTLIHQGSGYIQLMLASITLLIVRVSINGILRSSGDAALAMQTLWITHTVNILLCPVLIFGWGPFPILGLMGAALATLAARLTGVLYQCYFLLGKKTIVSIGKEQLSISMTLMKKIMRLASAGTAQYLIPASSWVLMIKIIAHFGSHALAGYIIAQRVTSITTMPAWGIGNAAGVLTGQNLGANQADRAEQSVWKAGIMNMFFLLFIALLWWLSAESVVGFFSEDPEVLANGVTYIHYLSLAYVLLAYTMVISRALNASGNVSLVTVLYIFMFYIIQLPLAYFLGIFLNKGTEGIFIAMLISEIILAVACILIFRRGQWKYRKL